MDSAKFKKMLLHLLPAALFAFIGNIVSFSVRNAAGHDISDKFMSFIDVLSNKLTIPLPSLHWIDLLVGLASGAAFYGLWRLKKSNAKQFRSGKEHGSARWGTVEESKALRAKRFCDNLIITATLWMTMQKPKIIKLARKETIDIINTSLNKGQSTSSGVSYQKQGRELMTSEEIFTMDRGKCIARVGGFHPFFCDKYDITKHPMYGCLLDAHMGKPDEKKFTFDIAAYTHSIRKQQKATVSGDTVVDVYEAKTGK